MKDPIDRDGLRHRFWEKVPLKNLSPKEPEFWISAISGIRPA